MNYGEIVAKLKELNSSIIKAKESITNIDLKSIWEGNAQKKQTNNLEELTSSLDKQTEQLNTLSEIMTSIDKYDQLTKEIKELTDQLNSLDDEDEDYAIKYHEISEQIRKKTEEKNNLKVTIESSLNNIATTYASQYEKIPATEIEKTLDVFEEAEAIGLKLGNAFEILATKSTKDKVSSEGAGTITLDKQGTYYEKEPTPGKSAQKLHVYHNGERLYDDAEITVKKGDTIRLTVNLTDNCGEVKQLKRTSADGYRSDTKPQNNWTNYFSAQSEPFVNRYDSSTFVERDNFDWVITADKVTNGYVTLSQTTFHSTDQGEEFKSMYRIKIKVVE